MYTNRFTFTNMPSKVLVERGLDYLTNIKSIEIDGNLVTAYIQGTELYEIKGWIDFTNRKFRYFNCGCPYFNDGHNSCKHIAALMLYLDIYINGGSIDEMFDCFVMDAMVEHTKLLDELNVITSDNAIINSIINKKGFELHNHVDYAIPYSVINKKVDDKIAIRCFRKLYNYKVLYEDKKDHTYFIKKQYNNPYKVFFSKYGFLYTHEYEKEDEDDYYYEEYWGREEKTVYKGFNIIDYYSLFVGKNKKDDILGDKFINSDYSITYETDDAYNPEDVIFKINRHDMSDNSLAYFISTIKNIDRKQYLLDLFEKGDIDYFNIDEYLSSKNSEKNSFHIFSKEYFIGRAAKDLLDFDIPFYFEEKY